MTLAFLLVIVAFVVLVAVVALAVRPRAEVWTSKSPADPVRDRRD